VDECKEEHAPPSCALFKSKRPEERLAVVRRRELCILCFRHLDTKRCWSLGKVSNCNVRNVEGATTICYTTSCRTRK
jgi:hypothetical protein